MIYSLDKKEAAPFGTARSGERMESNIADNKAQASATRDDIVTRLRRRLGEDVVLLNVAKLGKNPVEAGWQTFTAAKMGDDSYLKTLNHGGNIGVLLGRNSGGLHSIDLDLDEAVEPFLALNPKLAATLRTKRMRGGNLWVRVTGPSPASVKLKTKDGKAWGEWRGDGNQTVIFGEAMDARKGEAEPTRYKITHDGVVVVVAFEEIIWPDNLVLPWIKEAPTPTTDKGMVGEFGEPFYNDAKGKPKTLNESFWSGVYANENHVLWEPTERAFFKYSETDGIYRDVSPDLIKNEISSRMLLASTASQMNVFWLQTQRTDRTLTAITAQLRGVVEERDAFQKRAECLALGNGLLTLADGGTFREFSPSVRLRHKSPVNYSPAALCPRFLNELVYPAVHPEDVALLQKYSGLALLGDNLIQRMLILDGEAGRGKSQWSNAIQAVVGRENVTQLRTRFLGDRFETYRFLRKSLLVGIDVEPDFLSTKGAAVLKGLVGGDWFDVERKGGTESFPMQGKFCCIVTSNARLRVRLQGDVGAWRRRLLIVRYEAPPPKKKIPDFGALLVKEEGSGILNWCLGGLEALLQDVAELGDISMTPRQKAVADALLEESDSLAVFLREKVKSDADGDVSVAELIEAYATFCPDRGWRSLPITEIETEIPGLMLDNFRVTKAHSISRDGKNVRGFRGVSLC
jgi:putative DNA primase/helicase